jgi:hypothetical protein
MRSPTEPDCAAPLDRNAKEAGNPLGICLSVLASVWHALLMTSAPNDNFLHLTLAKQWLAGDWPVRDFFDQGSILQYSISAVAIAVGGERLLSEAVVVGLCWAISAYLVFALVRRLTGYPAAAAVAAMLTIIAGARGYSYPKGIVYAVAATLWWQYVDAPTTRRVAIFGVWAAVAFYWRADHGLYVAAAIALACVAAHGLHVAAIRRCLTAGAAMFAIVAPFFGYVQATIGLPEYIQTGVAAAQTEHVTQGPHQWPVLRFGKSAVVIDPREKYAPTVGIRWIATSSPPQREEVRARYDLAVVEADDDGVERVRLSVHSLANLRGLINEPMVADTAGIDRSTASLASWSWPTSQRWRFNHASLRMHVLPELDAQARASEVAVALFYILPIAVMIAAPWLTRYLVAPVTTRTVVTFGVFVILVDAAMLRLPFPARAADAVVLTAVLFGCCVAAFWRAAVASRRWRRVLFAAAATALVVILTLSVAQASRFGERISSLTGGGTSLGRTRAQWSATFAELFASPPLDYFVDKRARFSLRLAAYVRDCVPEGDRLLVLWFEPEIYYYGDRLMAQRHLVFAPTWAAVPHEQRMALEKLTHFAPPIALARRSALESYASASYPGVVDYIQKEYQLAATILEDKEEYLIFVKRDRPIVRSFGSDNWPCFVHDPSVWSRVGHPKE